MGVVSFCLTNSSFLCVLASSFGTDFLQLSVWPAEPANLLHFSPTVTHAAIFLEILKSAAFLPSMMELG